MTDKTHYTCRLRRPDFKIAETPSLPLKLTAVWTAPNGKVTGKTSARDDHHAKLQLIEDCLRLMDIEDGVQ